MGKQMARGSKGHYQATDSLQQHSKVQAPWETRKATLCHLLVHELQTIEDNEHRFAELHRA